MPPSCYGNWEALSAVYVHDHFLERDLEGAIIRNLEQFILELGMGFTFVARQKRITQTAPLAEIAHPKQT